eukprot:4450652-Pyramimonas_sp.AAC.1
MFVQITVDAHASSVASSSQPALASASWSVQYTPQSVIQLHAIKEHIMYWSIQSLGWRNKPRNISSKDISFSHSSKIPHIIQKRFHRPTKVHAFSFLLKSCQPAVPLCEASAQAYSYIMPTVPIYANTLSSHPPLTQTLFANLLGDVSNDGRHWKRCPGLDAGMRYPPILGVRIDFSSGVVA